MITKQLICAYCGQRFKRTDYPSRFKIYKKVYCCKEHAMTGAREGYRPTQGIVRNSENREMIRIPGHPRQNKNCQITLASVIAEIAINRPLKINEIVHHIDENPLNNDPNNFAIMSRAEHQRLHIENRREANGRFR